MPIKEKKIYFIAEYYSNENILSNSELDDIKKEMCCYHNMRSVAVEALKIVQKKRGWISDEVIDSIAKVLNIPSSDLDEVATFYSQIFRTPVGKNIIRYCDSIVCYINGYQKIKFILEKILKISIGKTTADGMFTLLPTCCLGKCDQSPVIMINEDTYPNVVPEIIGDLLVRYK